MASDLRPEYSLDSLSALGGVEIATSALRERSFSEAKFGSEIRQLCHAPENLVVIFSNDSDLLSNLNNFLVRQYPVDGSPLMKSLSHQVLEALGKFFCGVSPPRELDGQEFKDHVAKASQITQVLRALAGMKFDKSTEEFPKSHGARTKKGKRPKRVSISGSVMSIEVNAVDSEAFKALGLVTPSSEVEASDLLKGLMDVHREILFYFLGLLELDIVRGLVLQKVLRIIAAPSDFDLPIHKAGEANELLPALEPPNTQVKVQPRKIRFPMIAPEKAKQAFDWPPGFVDWPIYISSAAIKQLRQFRRGEGTFKVIQEKITQLSQGLFSGSNQKRLEGVPSDVPIFEAKTTGDLRLIYRIDIDTDHYLKTDKQVIRIHGVYAHNQFDHRLWSRIARSSPRGDKEYRRMVNYRMEPRKRGARINFVTPPMTWPHEGRALVERLPVSNANALLTEDECIELHKIWSLAKFVPYSTAVLASIIEDIDTEHEFSVSPAEGKIIQHMSSCFVIGRSGTGKTTTMLFKLLLWEKAQRSNLLDRPGPIRQMFLTQSHVLASKVEEDYQKLFVAARIGTASGSKGRSRTRLAERHITELDEEAHVDHSGLPEKFSDLKDEHFPLFLTYEQLRRMLENEYGIQSSTSLSQCSRKDARSASSKHVPLLELDDDSWDPFGPPQKGYRDYDKNVTFDLFKSQYWIHFDQQKIKGLDPAQVYSEIMGIICGGEHTLKMPSGYMSRESYVSLSHRSYPSFAAERSRVYDVFEKYLKLKMHNRAFDNPERTHIILKHIDKAIMNIDFLYVDEVQDLLMIDAKLLRDLCPNPHGHFRGGDTAQAISVGSSFRFEDLGALVYREERSNSSVTSGARGPIKPTIFELPVYYRSHQGIVACAASIVDLITALFPYSIDKLRREESIAPGPNPCIFRDERVRWNNFLSDGKRASRAIIVRDDTTRDEVQAELGSTHYMIYTLLESKGLEFDDVLVYNFFASSPASSAQWRAVLGLQRADTTRYRVLETELKRLYVALTRARLHIWIWDSSPTADPMLNYWLSKDLVEICHPSKPFPQLDATPSTTDEWNDMARTLFSKFLYTQAASCFNKAGRKDDHDIALAYQQRKDARAISKNDKRIAAFRDAGAAFRACAEASSAGTRALRRNAAGCFVLSKEFKDAAKEFEEALEYTDAAINYHRAELLEDVARLVRPPDGSISLVTRRTREGLLDNIRIQYLRAGDLKHAELLFDHVEDEISFVEDYLSNSSYLIASIHERRRAFMSAARIYSSIGQDMKAASCWARSDSPARAASSLLDAMWNVAFNIADLEHHRATLNNIPSNSLAEATRMEVEMFRAIIGRNASALCSLGRSFVAKRSTAGAILSFKHALKHDLDFDNEDLSGLFSKLSNVESYCRQLIALLRDRRLCSNPTAQKLAGFHPAIGQAGEHVPDEFCALPNSYAKGLVEQAPPSRPVKILSKMKDGSVHVKGEDLYLLLRHNLEAEMEELLVRVHSKLLRASILHLCLEHLLQVDCGKKISSCRKLHLEAGSQDMLGLYFRVHMQIVTTLDCLWHLPTVAPYDVYAKVRRKWLKQIFTVLFPVTRMLGNHTILDLRRLEAHRAMPIVQNWIEHRIRGINASKEHPLSPDSHFATNAVMLLLMAHFFHGGRLPRYLWYGLKLYYRHDELEDHQTGSSVIHDLTWMLVCDSQVPVDNGVRFLRWVVEKKPPIDLNVLVHFLEILCIQLVFQCSSRRPRPLHNLLLPRSWAIRVLDMFSDNPPTIFRIRELLTPIIEILHNISGWDGSGVFTLHGNAFPRSWPLRQEMIVRICRALVIVGCNGPYEYWPGIFDAIKTLDYFGPPGNRYAGFLKARRWWDMVQALIAHGGPDSLVVLCQNGAGMPSEIQTMVECIRFSDRDELRDKLTGVHRHVPLFSVGLNTNKYPDQWTTTTTIKFIEDTQTVKKITPFVILIQQRYRRLVARRVFESSEFQKVFLACAKSAEKIKFQSYQGSVHRFRFLVIVRGPLPHVLFALSRILVEVRNAKQAAKCRLDTTEPGDSIIECKNQITALNHCHERVSELQREIGPESAIFRSGSSTDLGPRVLEVDALLNKLESSSIGLDMEPLRFHMAIGIKGIVTPAPQKRPLKPSLNAEDLDWY